MGTCMYGIVECWVDPTKYSSGHWEDFAEIQYNKWYELQATIFNGSPPASNIAFFKEDQMSGAIKDAMAEDIYHGFRVIEFEQLEKLWKDFDSTALATVEFMRAMSLSHAFTRLVVYFS